MSANSAAKRTIDTLGDDASTISYELRSGATRSRCSSTADFLGDNPSVVSTSFAVIASSDARATLINVRLFYTRSISLSHAHSLSQIDRERSSRVHSESRTTRIADGTVARSGSRLAVGSLCVGDAACPFFSR